MRRRVLGSGSRGKAFQLLLAGAVALLIFVALSVVFLVSIFRLQEFQDARATSQDVFQKWRDVEGLSKELLITTDLEAARSSWIAARHSFEEVLLALQHSSVTEIVRLQNSDFDRQMMITANLWGVTKKRLEDADRRLVEFLASEDALGGRGLMMAFGERLASREYPVALRHLIETLEWAASISDDTFVATLSSLTASIRQEVENRIERLRQNTILLGVAMLILVVLIVVFWIRELRILNEDLERRVVDRTTELRAAQAELLRKERLATLGQLTATVSHELRNPMGVIRTSAYVVRRSLAGESGRVQRAMERIERNVIRCDRIIDELLDFARIKELVREPTALDAWLEETLSEQNLPPEIVLRRDFNLSNAIIPIDHDRFRRAVINVFDNACQAMTAEGVEPEATDDRIITVRSHEREGRAELVFQDTGPGIPPEIREKIFEPLYSTKGFGVGLGLPTVQQIMEQHDGGIEIESIEGAGTRVTLWLPYTNSR